MELSRIANPVFHFDDALGVPLAGGRLFTYVAGTLNPATAYKDKTGTIHPNPIILNSRGEAEIYLDNTKSYKFVVKNAIGVSVLVADNITANTKTFRAVGSDTVEAIEETVDGQTVVTFKVKAGSIGKAELKNPRMLIPDDETMEFVQRTIGDTDYIVLKSKGGAGGGVTEEEMEAYAATKVHTHTKSQITDFPADAPSDGKQYARKNGAWSEVQGGGSVGRRIYNYVPFSNTGTVDIENGILKNFNYNNCPVKNLSSLCSSNTKKIELNIRFQSRVLSTSNQKITLFGHQESNVYYRFCSCELQYTNSNYTFNGIWLGITSNGISWNETITLNLSSFENLNTTLFQGYNELNLLIDIENSIAKVKLNGVVIGENSLSNPQGIINNMSNNFGFGSIAQNNQTFMGTRGYIDLINTWVKFDDEYVFQFFEPEAE